MMVETLSQVFLNTVRTYVKDALLLVKKDGRYTPISTQEFGRRVEHLSRGVNWEIRGESDPYTKKEAQLIEFRVALEPGAEKIVRYTVHYTW